MTDNDLWAIVEIMGHRQRAGRLSDAAIGGATLLRIEHPHIVDGTAQGEALTEYYAPTALFAIRPCTRDQAVAHAAVYWRTEAERTLRALASVGDTIVEAEWEDE